MIIDINLCILHFSSFKVKYSNINILRSNYRGICEVNGCHNNSYYRIGVDLNSANKQSELEMK